MSQYIVTEEKIQKWVELDYSAKDCRNEVKEHPYNSKAERDEVLNEAIEFMKNKIRLPTNSGEQLSYEADIRFKVISEVKKNSGR